MITKSRKFFLLPVFALAAVTAACADATAPTALSPTSASFAVTFDPDDGTGFVGKGDVQSAFGWNNTALQNNAGGVTFSFAMEVQQDAICEGEQGNSHLIRTGTRSGSVGSEIDYLGRRGGNQGQQQINGFILTGFLGDVDEEWGDWVNETQQGNDDIIPACLNNSQGWEMTSFDETILSGPSLFVHHGNQTRELQF